MSFYLLDHAVNNGTIWQQWGYPRRGAKLSGTCIIHTSESVLDVIGPDSTAEDCAAFIGRRTGDYGSYHDLVDSDSIIEMAPFEYETWQDSETNPWAVGLSAACRTTDWATMSVERRDGFLRNLAWCAADFIKYMKEAYNITVPLRRISGAEARARVPGFCAHGDSGINRSDPGKDFRWDLFFKYTQEILDGVTPVVIPKRKKKMLYFADGGDGKVWIGDGLIRWHVPDPNYLQHYRNVGSAMDQFRDGEIQRMNPEVLGLDIVSVIKTEVAKAVGKVALEQADVAAIASQLANTLAPNLAKDLAKRLAE